MEKMDDATLDELKSLVFKTDLKYLKALYLHGNGEMRLSKITEFLPVLLSVTTRQIFIDSFILEKSDLELLLTHSHKSKNLTLVNWEIGELKDRLEIKENKEEYKLQELDLYWTAIENNPKYLDRPKMEILLKSLNELKIKDTLSAIHIWETDFNKTYLEKLIRDLDLAFTVQADKEQPKPFM